MRDERRRKFARYETGITIPGGSLARVSKVRARAESGVLRSLCKVLAEIPATRVCRRSSTRDITSIQKDGRREDDFETSSESANSFDAASLLQLSLARGGVRIHAVGDETFQSRVRERESAPRAREKGGLGRGRRGEEDF